MSLIGRITGLSTPLKAASIALAVLGAVLVWNFVDDYFSKEAETRAELSENQADAALESGKDAVDTIGRVNERITERFHTTERIINEVENAEDFDSAHAIGIDGLCNITTNLCPQDPMQ